jgi:hypothetical protein
MELGCGVGLCATAALSAPARTIAAGRAERISSVRRNQRTRASDLSPQWGIAESANQDFGFAFSPPHRDFGG